MKKIDVQVREKKGFYEFRQLYANLNEENDIHINGSVTLGNSWEDVQKIRVYANLCNRDGEILYVLNSYRNFDTNMGNYYSFSIYCAEISRFFEINELSYVELYILIHQND